MAKGYMDALEGSSGDADILEDLLLYAVNTSAHAQNFLNYWLAYKGAQSLKVDLTMNWRAIRTGPGAYFSYNDPIFGEKKIYRMSEFKPEDGKLTISGVAV